MLNKMLRPYYILQLIVFVLLISNASSGKILFGFAVNAISYLRSMMPFINKYKFF